jgi:hypothetical protein
MKKPVSKASGVVIVGGGLAAARTAEQLRKSGYTAPVTIVSDEQHLPYDRPPLSKDVLHDSGRGIGDVTLKPAEFYADNDIALPPLEPFGQGYQSMSPALEAMETHLLNGSVAHPQHPVLTWCAANAVVQSDAAENRKLAKDKANGRIDLMVAAVMGAGLVARQEPAGRLDDFIYEPLIG